MIRVNVMSGGGSVLRITRKSYNFVFFFFNDPATTEISTLPLHAPLPISPRSIEHGFQLRDDAKSGVGIRVRRLEQPPETVLGEAALPDPSAAARVRQPRLDPDAAEIGRAHV